MGFIWHLHWPESVVNRKKCYNDMHISICLGIHLYHLNFSVAKVIIKTVNFTNNPSPVDRNTVQWMTHACMKSLVGMVLEHFFCALLLNTRVGINSRWLSTNENIIVDVISQIKKVQTSNYFDYHCTFQFFHHFKLASHSSKAKSLSHAYGSVC